MRLYVAVPIYGGVDPHFHQCFTKLLLNRPCEMVVDEHVGDSLVARSRNTLTARFLASDCTDLLFLDSDLIFSTDHVARLISHDVDIVGGFYPKKQEGALAWVCNAMDKPQPIREDELQQVKYMGTGFLRIRRHVFEAMIWEHKADPFTVDETDRVEWDFWHCGVYQYPDGKRRYLSEDWWFCQMALDLGIQVYGDTRIALKHSGGAVYPLRSQHDAWMSAMADKTKLTT